MQSISLCRTEKSQRLMFYLQCIKATSNRIMLLHCVLLSLEQNWFTAREDRKQVLHHSAQLLQEASTEQPKIEHLLRKIISPFPPLQGFLTISIQTLLLHDYYCKVPGSRLSCTRICTRFQDIKVVHLLQSKPRCKYF